MIVAVARAVPTPVRTPRTPVCWLKTEVVVSSGKGQNGVEMFALNPVLILAGCVPCVFADLEHVDNDYLDFDRLLRGLRDSARERKEQR